MALPAPYILPRGVWLADYLVKGQRALLAVDSRGALLKLYPLAPDADEDCARAWLEGLLDHYDPLRPALRLMRGPTRPRLSPATFLRMLR